MADLTLAQRFGASATLNATTKTLTINLNDLATISVYGSNYGLDVSAMTDTNKGTYVSRILWALLQLQRVTQPADNNDNTVGVIVTNQGKRAALRNNIAQTGFQLVATAYKNDTEGSELDPDNIV